MTDTWRPYRVSQLRDLLTSRDLGVLEDLERFRLLDARLIQQLHFRVGSEDHRSVSAATRATNRVLTRLGEHGFVAPLARRIGGPQFGSAATVWQLAAAGERLLRARRGEPQRRRYVEPTHGFMEHTLEVARHAARIRLASDGGSFDLLELDAEPACWRTYSDPQGEAAVLKPDLYVVTADREVESHNFVEVDRGTEHLPAILRKCRVYQRHFQSGAEQARSGVYPRVLWSVPDAERARLIRLAIDRDGSFDPALFDVTTTDAAIDRLAPSTQPKGGTHEPTI